MSYYPPTPAFGGFSLSTEIPGPPKPTNGSANVSSSSAHQGQPSALNSSYPARNGFLQPKLSEDLQRVSNASPADSREEGELSDGDVDDAPLKPHVPYEGENESGRRSKSSEDEGSKSYQEAPYSPAMGSPENWKRGNGRGRRGSNRGKSQAASRPLPPQNYSRKPSFNSPPMRNPPSQPRSMPMERNRGQFETNFAQNLLAMQHDLSRGVPPEPPPLHLSSNNGFLAAPGAGNNVPRFPPVPIVKLQTGNTPSVGLPELVPLRKEAEESLKAILSSYNITFKDIVEETGINESILKSIYTRIGEPVSPGPGSPRPPKDRTLATPTLEVTKSRPQELSSDKMEIDKDAQAIRKQLEKDMRDKERREAEARAAELVRKREAAKEEEERKRRSAEVQAAQAAFKKKLEMLKLNKRTSPEGAAPTPISTTPIIAAAAMAPTAPPVGAPAPSPVPQIPGLLLHHTSESETEANNLAPSGDGDTIMEDAPLVTAVPNAVSGVSPGPNGTSQGKRPMPQRRKRPVAADLYSETLPVKRKFGAQRSESLIIQLSEDEDEDTDVERGLEARGADDFSDSYARGNEIKRSQTSSGNGSISNGHSKAKDDALRKKEQEIQRLRDAIKAAQEKRKLQKNGTSATSTPAPISISENGTTQLRVAQVPPPRTSLPTDKVDKDLTEGQLSEPDSKLAVEKPVTKDKMSDETKIPNEKDYPIGDGAGEEQRQTLPRDDGLTKLQELQELQEARNETALKDKEEKERAEKAKQLEEANKQKERHRIAREKLKAEMLTVEREAQEMEQRRSNLAKQLRALEESESNSSPVAQATDGDAPAQNDVEMQDMSSPNEVREGTKELSQERDLPSPTPSFGSELPSGRVTESPFSPPPATQPDDNDTNGHLDAAIPISSDSEKSEKDEINNNEKAQQTDVHTNEATAVELVVEPVLSKPVEAEEALPSEPQNKMELETTKPTADTASQSDVEMESSSEAEESSSDDSDSDSSTDDTSSEEEADTVEQMQREEPSVSQVNDDAARLAVSQDKHSETIEANTPLTVVTTEAAKAKEIVKSETAAVPDVFRPYVSPLTAFKSLRYHPKLHEFTKDGIRSLTYSNRINPAVPFCWFEVNGGICNDSSCRSQHFRDISLHEDEILVEMAITEGTTEEERSRYSNGLRQEITSMRDQGVQDFETVASRIADYRRRFFGDTTRVVRL